MSRGNIERLYELNPETAATDYELFRRMNSSVEFKKEMLKGAMNLQHGKCIVWIFADRFVDFTQYWPDVKAARVEGGASQV